MKFIIINKSLLRSALTQFFGGSLTLLLFLLSIEAQGQYWDVFFNDRFISDERGNLRPLKPMSRMLKKADRGKIRKVDVYVDDTVLVEQSYYDKQGRLIRSNQSMLLFGLNWYDKKHDKKNGYKDQHVHEWHYKYKNDNTIMTSLSNMGDSLFHWKLSLKDSNYFASGMVYNLGLAIPKLETQNFLEPRLSRQFKVRGKHYKRGKPRDGTLLWEIPEIVKLDSVKWEEMADDEYNWAYAGDAAWELRYFGKENNMAGEGEFSDLLLIDSLLSRFYPYRKGYYPEDGRYKSFKKQRVLAYYDTAGNIRGFEGKINGIKVRGSNLTIDGGFYWLGLTAGYSYLEFDFPKEYGDIKRITLSIDRFESSYLPPLGQSTFPSWIASIYRKQKISRAYYDRSIDEYIFFSIPHPLVNNSLVKIQYNKPEGLKDERKKENISLKFKIK